MSDLASGPTRTSTTTADLLRMARDEAAHAYQRARRLVYDVTTKGQVLTPLQHHVLAKLKSSEANLAELRQYSRERRSRAAER